MQWLTGVRQLSYTHSVAINYMQMLLDLMEERQKWLNQRDEAIREISRLSELIRATMNMIPAEQIARYEPIFERLENRPAGLSMAIRACFTGGTAPALFLAERYKGAKNKEVESKAEKASPGEGGMGTGREAEGGREAGREAEEGRLETTGIGSERTGSEKDAAWLTPVEIRDALKRMGFPFENYKANPLASIHTTLKRMVPAEMETKTLADGQKVYRLKSAGQWAAALAEARQWLTGNFEVHRTAGSVIAVKRVAGQQAGQKAASQETSEKDRQEGPPAEGAKRGTSGGA
jgi:hypothetical protein